MIWVSMLATAWPKVDDIGASRLWAQPQRPTAQTERRMRVRMIGSLAAGVVNGRAVAGGRGVEGEGRTDKLGRERQSDGGRRVQRGDLFDGDGLADRDRRGLSL